MLPPRLPKNIYDHEPLPVGIRILLWIVVVCAVGSFVAGWVL